MNVAQMPHGAPQQVPPYETSPPGPTEPVARPVIRQEMLSYRRLQPQSGAGPADIPLLGEAYRCWSEVWKTTLLELDNLQDVPSDEFTRQDEIGALFHGYECVGLTCFRWIDAAQPMFQDDSYFKIWPLSSILASRELGSRICVLSNLTVAAHWRRATGVSVMDILGALSVDRFLASDGDALVATPRSDRGVNRLCYRLGFSPLERDVMHHGVKIDLVGFYRRTSERLFLSSRTEGIVAALQST